MILLIDNYDSFVHNIARYVGELGRERRVVRNDAIDVDDIAAELPHAIILSPGPGTPDDAGVSLDVVRRLGERVPILGVCLGHQCIGQAYGGTVRRAQRPVHGKISRISHDDHGVFAGLPNPLRVGRYHSLVVDVEAARGLEATAYTDEGEVMGLAHRWNPVVGVQFHPESVLTERGHDLLKNFLKRADEWHKGIR
jgi:anthranilate synthase/aminodeoxychorismate synthase-like glutamine amidotransferase